MNINYQNQTHMEINENNFTVITCHKCGWIGIGKMPTPWIIKAKRSAHKKENNVRCPFCG